MTVTCYSQRAAASWLACILAACASTNTDQPLTPVNSAVTTTIVGNVAPEAIAVQAVPLGSGPVVVITEHAATDRQVVYVTTAGEQGPARELLRTGPDHALFVVQRLDAQRLLCQVGGMFPSRLFIVDAAAGSCRDLDVDACRGFHVVGDHIVFAERDTIGRVAWRSTAPALRLRVPQHRDLQRVGSVVFACVADRAVRIDLEHGSIVAFGPRLARDTALTVSPDGSEYALGNWMDRPTQPVGTDARFGTQNFVEFAAVTLHEMSTDRLIDAWADEPLLVHGLSSRIPTPPTCSWLGDGEVLRWRLVEATGGQRIVRFVRSRRGEARCDAALVGAVAPALRSPSVVATSDDAFEFMPPRTEPHCFPSPDKNWIAEEAEPMAKRSTVDLVCTANGSRRMLGEFATLDISWLPAVRELE